MPGHRTLPRAIATGVLGRAVSARDHAAAAGNHGLLGGLYRLHPHALSAAATLAEAAGWAMGAGGEEQPRSTWNIADTISGRAGLPTRPATPDKLPRTPHRRPRSAVRGRRTRCNAGWEEGLAAVRVAAPPSIDSPGRASPRHSHRSDPKGPCRHSDGARTAGAWALGSVPRTGGPLPGQTAPGARRPECRRAKVPDTLVLRLLRPEPVIGRFHRRTRRAQLRATPADVPRGTSRDQPAVPVPDGASPGGLHPHALLAAAATGFS